MWLHEGSTWLWIIWENALKAKGNSGLCPSVSQNQEKRKKDASKTAPQPTIKKYNWTTELLENSAQHEQYVNKQFNDLKKADLIEKCNYIKLNQTVVLMKYSHCH